MAWLSEQALPEDERLAIERHLREFDRLGEDLAVIERNLARSALADENVARLMAIPGVDMIVLAITSQISTRRACSAMRMADAPVNIQYFRGVRSPFGTVRLPPDPSDLSAPPLRLSVMPEISSRSERRSANRTPGVQRDADGGRAGRFGWDFRQAACRFFLERSKFSWSQVAFRDCATPARPVRSVRFPGLRRRCRRERDRSCSTAIGRAINLHIDTDFSERDFRGLQPFAERRRLARPGFRTRGRRLAMVPVSQLL